MVEAKRSTVMPFEEYTTVEEVLDGDVILIGEQHEEPGASRSNDLAWEVIGEYSPQTVAIEAYRPLNRTGTAQGALYDYSREEGIPLVAIDENNQWGDLECDRHDLHEVANTFSHPIQEDGDLDAGAIYDSRSNVLHEFGEEAFEMMYEDRELAMAQRIRGTLMRTSVETPLVVAMGAFHVPIVRDHLTNGELVDAQFLDGARVLYPDEE